MRRHVIDAFDYKGDTWSLLAPPLKHEKRSDELWMLVAKTTADGLKQNYPCIPVPCFTEWWPA